MNSFLIKVYAEAIAVQTGITTVPISPTNNITEVKVVAIRKKISTVFLIVDKILKLRIFFIHDFHRSIMNSFLSE